MIRLSSTVIDAELRVGEAVAELSQQCVASGEGPQAPPLPSALPTALPLPENLPRYPECPNYPKILENNFSFKV